MYKTMGNMDKNGGGGDELLIFNIVHISLNGIDLKQFLYGFNIQQLIEREKWDEGMRRGES